MPWVGVLDGEGDGGGHDAAQPDAGHEPGQAEKLGRGASAHRPMASENHVTQPSMIRRRPTRSVTVPTTAAPTSMPMSAYEPMRPASGG